MATPVKWGAEFLLEPSTDGAPYEPSIAALANGRFVFTWSDWSEAADDPTGSAIRAQVFNADGSSSEGDFLVNTKTAGSQGDSSIASLPDGRFVVAYTDYRPSLYDPDRSAIRAQIYNPDGSRSDQVKNSS